MQTPFLLSLLKFHKNLQTLKELKLLHLAIIQTGLQHSSFAVGNFISQCSSLGFTDYAHQVFDQMIDPNTFVYNTIIRAFQQNKSPQTSLIFFHRMRPHRLPPDHFTFPFLIKACADLHCRGKGEFFHGIVLKSRFEIDVFVGTSLIEFYAVCRDMKLMRQVFDEMPVKDVVSWTVIISLYAKDCNDIRTAHCLYDTMPFKDVVPSNIIISEYIRIGELKIAGEVLENSPTKDLLMCNTMLGGYAKYGETEAMLKLFDEMSVKDVVSWNTVITGLVQSKRVNEAVGLFNRMQVLSVRPNEVTLVCVLAGCTQAGALDMGRWVHSYVDRNNFGLGVMVGTALVDMYSKCGALKLAESIFDQIVNRDVTAWNAMIMGFSMNGESKKALDFFFRMLDEDIKPNEVTIVGVLCACTHAGLVEKGRQVFAMMEQELGIIPKVEHYGCMVDLLGRAGLLNEASDFIKAMPLVPHVGVWGALLGACKIHANVEIAEWAIKHLLEWDLEDGGYLAIMSNIYANAGRWDDVARVRKLMIERGVDKMPGCSSVEINGVIHEFGAGDKLQHTKAKEIYEMVREISKLLRLAGHVASTSEVFFDVEQEEKESALSVHSEKLAVAFGLLSTEKGATIRIVKNLRICGDCHSAMKLISSVFNREILVRDRSRFHHFKEGLCSCADYW